MAENCPVTCEVCSAKVSELRRGRCWGCYSRWVETRPVGFGARCVTCQERRQRVLRSVELFGTWRPMCFNCAGQVLSLEPMPATLAELRVVVSRERRNQDRRWGKRDSRVYQTERRVGERRDDATGAGSERIEAIEDEMILEVVVEGGADCDFDDMTRIHDLLPPPYIAGYGPPVE